jgi:methionyl-tRNA formyltransferase
MRVLFMGSGEVACPALKRLAADASYTIAAVVTQPDRPKGRNRVVAPCPVKSLSVELGFPVMTPERIGAPDAVDAIRALTPDIIVVAAYGQYIKPEILDLPPHKAINIHPSLLPRYRGASPIQWAIANGDKETGVTILYVSKEMDAGDIILQEPYPIDDEDTAETLSRKLAERGAHLLIQALNAIRSGHAPRTPQDEHAVTYVSKLTKEDGRVDWAWPARVIRNRLRGFTPWPGCYTYLNGAMLKIGEARVEEAAGAPGEVLACDKEGPLIATGDQALRLLRVQPEGKAMMTGAAYLCGHALKEGERLG